MDDLQSGIKWPIAKTSDGQYVKIENANRGGFYQCPECQGRFVARKGAVVRWHFAHYPGAMCTGEGSRHAVAKHYIAMLLGEPFYVSLKCFCSLQLPSKPYKVEFTDIKVEDNINNYRVDVTCKRKGQRICIEVVDANPTINEKRESLRGTLIEIIINDLNDNEVFGGEKLRERLNHGITSYLQSRIDSTYYFIHTWHGPCWRCHKDKGIARLCGGVQGEVMWSQDFPAKLLATMCKYAKLEWRTTGIVKEGYIANVCPHCGAVQGDWHLNDELMNILSSGNSAKVETIISLGE
ncbi:MAG: hypothetical protein HW384_615 [Dehalococcoidia bacterium]|nr:hypothetical protein [Dehalococcoidia bacterium]MBF8304383.1 hypothetical protein [Dehalococcoidia bacterium]